jgi:signal transduction histidine kinase
VADWLDAHDVDRAWEQAAVLVAAGVDTGCLDELADAVPAAALDDVVTWMIVSLTGTQVLAEMRESSGRISALVAAMRQYTYLDQGPEQDLDVHEGLEATLTVLGERLGTGVEVIRDFDPNLPTVAARGSELNQVWTNLITNAVDAMAGSGRLTLTTRSEGSRLLVDVADTGPGVPGDLRERIFDPYFTTKTVGQGAGLGLDVARRIVDSHAGDLRVTSAPGETHFTVRLPARSPADPAGSTGTSHSRSDR